jgi:hypothetical protein
MVDTTGRAPAGLRPETAYALVGTRNVPTLQLGGGDLGPVPKPGILIRWGGKEEG